MNEGQAAADACLEMAEKYQHVGETLEVCAGFIRTYLGLTKRSEEVLADLIAACKSAAENEIEISGK